MDRHLNRLSEIRNIKSIVLDGVSVACSYNAGDEAIFICMIDNLKKIFPNADILVIGNNHKDFISQYRVKEISHFEAYDNLDRFNNCDLFIIGGGGVVYDTFGTNPNLLNGYSRFLKLLLYAKSLNKHTAIYSIGVDEISTEQGEFYTKKIFELADTISVRSEYSIELLKRIGINKDIMLVKDPAFNLTPCSEERVNNLMKDIFPSYKKIIGVSIRYWDKNIPFESWGKILAEKLDEFTDSNNDFSILFIPFHKSVYSNSIYIENTSDYKASLGIKELMKNKDRVFISDENNSAQDKMGLISKCNLLIAMRLHSIVFGSMCNVPIIPLSYSEKCNSVIRDLNLKGTHITKIEELKWF